MSVWSYVQTVRVGAGSPLDVPGFAVKPDDLEQGSEPPKVRNVTAKDNGQMRYCGKCECWKPDRTHHCSSCRRCILRMDHHCPWFATCIGFNNQKFFIQFLCYVSLFCSTCFCSSFYAVYVIVYELDPMGQTFLSLNWVALLVVSFVMGSAETIFCLYSVYIACRNTTVLESMEAVRYRTSVPSIKFRYTEAPSSSSIGNIFNLGWKANLQQIMGQQTWEWFVPIKTDIGDGTWFEIDEKVYAKAMQIADEEADRLRRQEEYRRNQLKLLQEQAESTENTPLSYYR